MRQAQQEVDMPTRKLVQLDDDAWGWSEIDMVKLARCANEFKNCLMTVDPVLSGGIPLPYEDIQLEAGAFVAKVAGDLRSERQIFEILCRCLRLPSYFGFNWNALSECLKDLSWLSSELEIYLDVLSDAVLDWKRGESRFLEVVISERDRPEIHRLMLR